MEVPKHCACQEEGYGRKPTFNEVDKVEVQIPFPVILTWDTITRGGKVTGVKNVRFFTNDLMNASFEVVPVFESGTCVDATRGESGTLIVSCAKEDSLIEVVKNEDGFIRVTFKSRPKFVSFNGKKAVKYAESL